jgi:hypothetical protein
MSILIRQRGSKWEKAIRAEFADEKQLQTLLYESPELIKTEDDLAIVFTREGSLPGSGYTDLIGIDVDGNIFLVETKLARNPEIRREVIGQILEYAAFLWGKNYDDIDRIFQSREGKSIFELLSIKDPEISLNDLRQTVSANLADGRFRLFIVVDSINQELEKIIAFLSSRGGGLKLQAIAMPIYTRDNMEILAPQVYGQLNQPNVGDASRSSNLTIDQILAKSPDEHVRRLLETVMTEWEALGHASNPRTAGLTCQAKIGDNWESIFWIDPLWGIQPLFSTLAKKGVPDNIVKDFRVSVSNLQGFDQKKCLTDPRPCAQLQKLNETEVQRFVLEANKLVEGWRKSLCKI